MNLSLTQFTEQLMEYQDRLLRIATENDYAILVTASISDDGVGGTNTIGVTNMTREGISACSLSQTCYHKELYDLT